jgi:tetratricopeptide (TPR) repeat protein
MRAAALITLALVLATAPPAHANPSLDLANARIDFRNKNCDEAVRKLNFLLYPDPPKIGDKEELWEAHALYGACYCDQGQRDRAREEFTRAYYIQPEKSLDDAFYSACALRLFDTTKAELKEKAAKEAEKKRVAEMNARVKDYLEKAVVYENHPYYLNFLPFGVPQFTAKRSLWGSIFAGSQAVTFSTSAGIWFYLSTKYGFPRGKVPTLDAPGALRLQQIEIGSGALFLGFYAWGVYDAIKHYQAQTRIKADDSILPPELRPEKPPDKPTKTKKPTSSLHLTPLLLPDGGGLGLTWEN